MESIELLALLVGVTNAVILHTIASTVPSPRYPKDGVLSKCNNSKSH